MKSTDSQKIGSFLVQFILIAVLSFTVGCGNSETTSTATDSTNSSPGDISVEVKPSSIETKREGPLFDVGDIDNQIARREVQGAVATIKEARWDFEPFISAGFLDTNIKECLKYKIDSINSHMEKAKREHQNVRGVEDYLNSVDLGFFKQLLSLDLSIPERETKKVEYGSASKLINRKDLRGEFCKNVLLLRNVRANTSLISVERKKEIEPRIINKLKQLDKWIKDTFEDVSSISFYYGNSVNDCYSFSDLYKEYSEGVVAKQFVFKSESNSLFHSDYNGFMSINQPWIDYASFLLGYSHTLRFDEMDTFVRDMKEGKIEDAQRRLKASKPTIDDPDIREFITYLKEDTATAYKYEGRVDGMDLFYRQNRSPKPQILLRNAGRKYTDGDSLDCRFITFDVLYEPKNGSGKIPVYVVRDPLY